MGILALINMFHRRLSLLQSTLSYHTVTGDGADDDDDDHQVSSVITGRE